MFHEADDARDRPLNPPSKTTSIGRWKGTASMACVAITLPGARQAKHGPPWIFGPQRAGPPLPLKPNQRNRPLGDRTARPAVSLLGLPPSAR
ncbi:hypothetical protein VTN77DRAFT_8720 [Rasamsonia byssochlamydoides]|uniref:uncharacterized protein n=1 Tax=Rasamsonia byssochlamydoides TaxID=89139 RepID=UPI003742068A